MSGKSEAPKYDPTMQMIFAMQQQQQRQQALERWTPKAYDTSLGPLGAARATFDPTTGRLISSFEAAPELTQAVKQAQRGLLGYDTQAAREATRARSAAYDPMMARARTELGGFFSGLGPGGRRSSLGTGAMARFAEEQARNQASSLLDIENQAKARLMSELAQRSQLAYSPLQTALGVSTGQGQQLGQGLIGLGQGISSAMGQTQQDIGSALGQAQQANIQSQTKKQDKSGGLSSLIGGGLGLASSFIPGLMGGK